jgi:hypothetical protein
MDYIASAVIFGMAILSEYLMSGKDSILFAKIPMHSAVEKLFVAGFSIFAPAALGIGLWLMPNEPELAIWWFGSASTSAVIAIFLWDEILKLRGVSKVVFLCTAVAVILFVIWRTDMWVARKVEENGSVSISQAAAESKTIGLLNAKIAMGHSQELLEKQKKLTIRTELGKLLNSNVKIREKCQRDELPKGFSCSVEEVRWRDKARRYISKNMEPSYLARFDATLGTHMEYKKTPSGTFLQGEESNAVNYLAFFADTIHKFIKDFQN